MRAEDVPLMALFGGPRGEVFGSPDSVWRTDIQLSDLRLALLRNDSPEVRDEKTAVISKATMDIQTSNRALTPNGSTADAPSNS
jgi:hypothetical protein